jgi:hypothetical protein
MLISGDEMLKEYTLFLGNSIANSFKTLPKRNDKCC